MNTKEHLAASKPPFIHLSNMLTAAAAKVQSVNNSYFVHSGSRRKIPTRDYCQQLKENLDCKRLRDLRSKVGESIRFWSYQDDLRGESWISTLIKVYWTLWVRPPSPWWARGTALKTSSSSPFAPEMLEKVSPPLSSSQLNSWNLLRSRLWDRRSKVNNSALGRIRKRRTR